MEPVAKLEQPLLPEEKEEEKEERLNALYPLAMLFIYPITLWGLARTFGTESVMSFTLTEPYHMNASVHVFVGTKNVMSFTPTEPYHFIATVQVYNLFALVFSFPLSLWFLTAVVNIYHLQGFAVRASRWDVRGDAHAKFLPRLMDCVALTAVEFVLGMWLLGTPPSPILVALNFFVVFATSMTARNFETILSSEAELEEKQEKTFNSLVLTVLVSVSVILKFSSFFLAYTSKPDQPLWVTLLLGIVGVWNVFFSGMPYWLLMNSALVPDGDFTRVRVDAAVWNAVTNYVFLAASATVCFAGAQ